MATPGRGLPRASLKIPSGKFCTGKSGGPAAVCTQLVRLGSCVSSIIIAGWPWDSASYAGFVEAAPSAIIIRLQQRRLEREAGRPNEPAAFEHERHRVLEALRLEVGVDGFPVALQIGPVRRHFIVQRGAAP